MVFFEILTDEIKEMAGSVGGIPGGKTWEIVTALFGWCAALSLTSGLIASLLGYGIVAGYLSTSFGFSMVIAIKRDLIKIRNTKD
ncbi:MAG: hypothetical protein ACK5WQ_07325 [Alphaproteobacteria bacterium]|jgi:hypothetical protein